MPINALGFVLTCFVLTNVAMPPDLSSFTGFFWSPSAFKAAIIFFIIGEQRDLVEGVVAAEEEAWPGATELPRRRQGLGGVTESAQDPSGGAPSLWGHRWNQVRSQTNVCPCSGFYCWLLMAPRESILGIWAFSFSLTTSMSSSNLKTSGVLVLELQ